MSKWYRPDTWGVTQAVVNTVVDTVKPIADPIIGAVSDVGGAVLGAAQDVGKVLEGAASDLNKVIVKPTVAAVEGIVQGIKSDPVLFIAQTIAVATGNVWALPLVNATDTILAGGSAEDALKRAAITAVAQEVGSQVGTFAGSAAQSAVDDVATKIILEDVVGGAAGAAAASVVVGGNPLQALITGGVSAAVPHVLGEIPGFTSMPKSLQSIVASTVESKLSGESPTQALIKTALNVAQVSTNVLNTFDPKGEILTTRASRAIAGQIITNALSASLTGGDPSKAVKNTMQRAGEQVLANYMKSGIQTAVNAAGTAYDKAQKEAKNVNEAQESYKWQVGRFEKEKQGILDRSARIDGYRKEVNDAVAYHNKTLTQESYNAYLTAKNKYDYEVATFENNLKYLYPQTFERINGYIKDAVDRADAAQDRYESAMNDFRSNMDGLEERIGTVRQEANKTFVEALNPEFNADQYKKLNGIAANVDPYEHYLEEGQFKGLPVNEKQLNDVVEAGEDGTTTAKNAVAKSTATIPPEKVFDGKKYPSTAAAQQAAAKMGMTYFSDSSGNVYKILTPDETKSKIKDAESFGEAYAMARATYGNNATFEWKNPETGNVTKFSTQTKEEASAKANSGSFVAVPKEVTDYVTNRVTSNLKDNDLVNPADLSAAEYKSFINAYLNSTDAQKQAMLKSVDAPTFKAIDAILKEAPEAIKNMSKTPVSIVPSGNISASDYTNISGVIKTGIKAGLQDVYGVGVRGAELLATAVGADASTAKAIQTFLSEDKDKEFAKLVGNERVVAGGIASGLQSLGSFVVGGPIGSVLSLGAIAANNAWIEGTNAVIDKSGNTWSSEAEARKNGQFTLRKLTNEENAYRTALMTSLEMAGEAVGVPGLKKIMDGVPLGQGIDAMINGIKRTGAGLVNEEVSELATTAAQFAADKYASFGLGQNATTKDFMEAMQDTALSTAVAVGSAGSIRSAYTNLKTANDVVEAERAQVTPLTYNTPVARDSKGNTITLAELITAQGVANLDDLEAHNSFADLTPLVNVNAGIDTGNGVIRVGDLLSGSSQIADSTTKLNESAIAEIMRQGNVTPKEEVIAQYVGKPVNAAVLKSINTYVDQNYLSKKEVQDIARSEGYKQNIFSTKDVYAEYVKEGNEAQLTEQVRAAFDAKSTSFDEAKEALTKAYANAGVNVPVTDEQVYKFVPKIPVYSQDESEVIGRINKYVDENTYSEAEVKAAFDKAGFKASPEEIKQFVGNVNQLEQAKKLATYVADNTVTEKEVETLFKGSFYKYTPEEVKRFAGQYSQAVQAKVIGQYIDENMLSFDEAREHFKSLGYPVSGTVINTFVKQVNEVAGKKDIEAYVDPRQMTEDEAKAIFDAAGYKFNPDELKQFVGNFNESAKQKEIEAYIAPRMVTPDEVKAEFAKAGYKFSNEEIAQFAGQYNQDAQLKAIATYANQNMVSPEEAAAAFAKAGYTTKPEEVAQFVGQYNQAQQEKAIADYVNPRQTTEAEVQAAFDKAGFKASPEEVKQFAGQLEQAAQEKAIAGYVNPRQLTPEEAAAHFQSLGYKFSPEEVAQFAGQFNEEQQKFKIGEYVNPRQVTEAEARAYFASQNYTPSNEEVQQFVGQVNQAEQEKAMGEYVDPRVVSVDEVREAYKAAGLQDILEEDVTRFAGQRPESELAGQIKEYLPVASANAVTRKFDALSESQKKLASDLQKQGVDLNTAIDQVKAQTQQQYDALSQSQKQLADSLTKQGVDLNAAIAQVKEQTQTQFNSLTNEQKALAQQLTQQGIDLNTAINTVQTTQQQLQQQVGQAQRTATQQDLDVITRLQQQGAYDSRYDYNRDNMIDDTDRIAVQNAISQTPDTVFAPGADTVWSATGIYAQLQKQQEEQAAAARAEAQRQAAAQQAAAQTATQRFNRGQATSLVNQLMQAPDLTGQQVSVKSADPAKIGYVYDFSSIFANPAQEQMFVTPYAGGGAVRSDMDDVNEELLKILRG